MDFDKPKVYGDTSITDGLFLSISRLISPPLSPTVLGSLTRSGPNQTSGKLLFDEFPAFLVLSKLKIPELTNFQIEKFLVCCNFRAISTNWQFPPKQSSDVTTTEARGSFLFKPLKDY